MPVPFHCPVFLNPWCLLMTPLRRLGSALHNRQRWVLIALLSVLHLALLAGANTMVGMMCWLVDVGLFILWQPFIQAERRVDAIGLAAIFAVLAGGVWIFGWWLLIFWVAALAALVGGRVMFIDHRPTRIFYLIAFAYLLAALLVWLMPKVVPATVLTGPSLDREFGWGMPLLLVAMLLLPSARENSRPSSGMVDFFYSLFIFLLIAVLVLGSLAFMLLRQSGYIEAVFKTLLSMAVMLLLIGWAWNPRPGFSGVGVFFSRYLLTIGLPFEKWLHRLTAYSGSESDPERFLAKALNDMLELPWVDGGAWVAGARTGQFGVLSRFSQDFPEVPLKLTLHTRHKLSPALVWHFHLLAQLTNEYYVAKLRARELQQISYLRAVHETGARLTHDVKNLLQSLNNLCYLAQTMDGRDSARVSQLLQRQLPQVTQRLGQTLEKLQAPQGEAGVAVAAEAWWAMVAQRYENYPVDFELMVFAPKAKVPAEFFDSALDNLLQNALAKSQNETGLQIRVSLSSNAAVLHVCDSGSPVSGQVLPDLFLAPLASDNGLGIGLYNVARQADAFGYQFRLSSNVAGKVCFELSQTRPAA
jgi:signal transduction histidine kinase